MPNTAIFFADGLEEIEGLTVVDLFRRADIPINIVSITGRKSITGSHGIIIQADLLLDELDFEHTDMLILPGGMPGTRHLGACTPLCRQLQLAAEKGRYIAAICAAPGVLGQLGILSGYKATCYPGNENLLNGAQIKNIPVVVDRNIITSRGMGTAIAFATELIALLKDRKTAEALKESIIYNN